MGTTVHAYLLTSTTTNMQAVSVMASDDAGTHLANAVRHARGREFDEARRIAACAAAVTVTPTTAGYADAQDVHGTLNGLSPHGSMTAIDDGLRADEWKGGSVAYLLREEGTGWNLVVLPAGGIISDLEHRMAARFRGRITGIKPIHEALLGIGQRQEITQRAITLA